MTECYICFISGSKEQLLDGVSSEGVMKVCRKCAESENIPIIKKQKNLKPWEGERHQSVHERLSRMAGLEVKEKPKVDRELKKQETTLKEIVDRNYESRAEERGVKTKGKAEDLVDNFHWVLMRVRRLQKVTPEEVAQNIKESPSAIKMLEKGVLADNYIELVKKLERYYNIKLIKDKFREKIKTPITVVPDPELLGKPEVIFKEDTSRALTINDLRSLKQRTESEIFEMQESFPSKHSKERLEEPNEFSEPDYMIHEHASDDEPEFVERYDGVKDISEEDIEPKDIIDIDEELKDESSKSGEELTAERVKQEKGDGKKEKIGKRQLSNEEIDKILYGGR